MSDDSFFREVNEELRQDKVKVFWRRFGKWLIAGAVAIVAVTAGYLAWERYQTAQANASGDAYLAALDLAQAGDYEAAAAAFSALAEDGFGAYPDLARMRLAAVREAEGNDAAAVEVFDAVTNDESAPPAIRDAAAIRAAYILVDSGTREDVQGRVERLSGDSDPLRFPAREALGLAAWKAGDRENARALFQQLLDDPGTPNGIGNRARLMLDVIASGDAPPATQEAQAEAAPPASEPVGAEPPSAPPAAAATDATGAPPPSN